MAKLKLFTALAAAVIAPAFILAGCSSNTSITSNSGGGSSSNEITIKFANWVSAEDATRANVDKVIKAFEDQHPNVKVENVSIPFDNMYQQLVTMASANNLPDVMMLSGPWTQELGSQGLLSDLTPPAGQQYLDDNWPGALDAGKYNGTLYSIPSELTPHGFWFNKDLMKQAGLDPNKPPTTLDELSKDCAQIKAKLGSQGIYPLALDTTKIDYALVQFWPWFYAYGAKPLYGDQSNFDTQQVQNALQFMRDTVKKGYTPVGQQIKDERELMAKDKVVFKLDGPYLVGILRSLNSNLNGDAFYKKFGVTTVPTGVNDKTETLADIHQLAISSKSKNQDVDWQFIKFFASSQTAVDDYEIPVGAIPPLKSLETKDKFGDAVSQAYISGILPSMAGGPYGPNYAQEQQVIIQAMQEAALSDTPITQITQKADQQLKSIVGK